MAEPLLSDEDARTLDEIREVCEKVLNPFGGGVCECDPPPRVLWDTIPPGCPKCGKPVKRA